MSQPKRILHTTDLHLFSNLQQHFEQVRGNPEMIQPKRILQITDLHLFNDQQTKLVGFNPYQSLLQIIAKITDSIIYNQPSLVAITGDISQDYSIESYDIAKKIFSKFTCPMMATMGNHDYPPAFIKSFGDPTLASNKIFTLDNWRMLFLNSYYPEHVGGQLAQGELNFLQENLAAFPKQPTMIFLHHQILPVGSTWLDNIKVTNSSQFLEIIDQYQNIKVVVCGHVHQDTSIWRAGVNYLSTPSTSWQFAVKSPGFKLDILMPGYRWIDLYEDGSFQTEVVRLDYNDMFIPDLNSKGY